MVEATTSKDGASTSATSEELQARSRNVNWYVKDLPEVPAAAREVFEQYSQIPAGKAVEHITQIVCMLPFVVSRKRRADDGQREQAWDIWPFPCLGGWRFLNLNIRTTAQYPDIVSRVQQGEKLLDLGCCFGQELRRLIFDGAPAENLYGVDLRPEFFDLGYDLFLDRDTCKATFIAADAFTEPEAVMALNGQISIVYAGAFFHLFDRPQQLFLAKLVTRLLEPKAGSLLLGRQVGSIKPGSYEHRTNSNGRMFRHDEQSWRELWEEAGREMGVSWSVEVELKETERLKGDGLGSQSAMQMQFCVRRL